MGNTNPGPPFPPATQAQLERAAAEIFGTLAAHVQLHADDLHTNPDALLKLVIAKAKRGLPPERVR